MGILPTTHTHQDIMNLNDIGREAHEVNAVNGWDLLTPDHWHAPQFLCMHMALIHTEVSEATEAIRKRDRENFEEELADCIIRLSSVAHGMGIDLEKRIAEKLEKNRSRGFRHGGKAC